MICAIKLLKDQESNEAIAALVILTYPEMKIQSQDFEKITLNENKIFSFQSFQHAPFLIKLIQKLEKSAFYPQLVITFGSGIWSIGIGLAQHIGAALNIPSFSVKNDFNDKFDKDGAELKDKSMLTLKEGGDFMYITGISGQKYGIIYKSTNNKEDLPIIVAVGNSIDFESIIQILKKTCKYKHVMPEPLRIISDITMKLFKSQIKKKKKK